MEEVEEVEEQDDAEEVEEIELPGHGRFFTTNSVNGQIYSITADDDIGDVVGVFINGQPKFNKTK